MGSWAVGFWWIKVLLFNVLVMCSDRLSRLFFQFWEKLGDFQRSWEVSRLFWEASELFWDVSEFYWEVSQLFWDVSERFWEVSELIWEVSEPFWEVSQLFWEVSELFWEVWKGKVCFACMSKNAFQRWKVISYARHGLCERAIFGVER
jgi:hypothetical protein